ncbi:hypothetical protein COV24_02460 [candidate division WWE3 bacterium CG10_big_fil_rev_8_21_14_0_10_32_10]|uniref:O-antigen ligase-related domain-containing protein n=1 Tax=candidate division WWE3 bacterium CG10_big_fil_rev_8_21_14_0_10_32_10 TaxID=1975090 RepID=A0A2H0RCD3_UNCKA|nr:MAG: hypothetical protein COV24_02460 [candidate division WWE3 bacterium CG10_big_fil_rev_8_21_14_0_10_32_10]
MNPSFFVTSYVSIKKFIEKHLLSILFLGLLLNSSININKNLFYVRGILIDYLIPRIYLNYFLYFFILAPFFIPLLKKYYKVLFYIFVFVFINILFSENVLYSLSFVSRRFIYIFLFLLLFYIKPKKISLNFIFILNFLYIFVFIIQFFSRSSVFPFFPFGFYPYKGVIANIDYIGYFGNKWPVPLGNFPHPNLFAAFLGFINIFYIKKISSSNFKKNWNRTYTLSVIIFFINILLALFLGSITGLLFSIVILIYFFRRYITLQYLYYLIFIVLFFVLIFIFDFSIAFKKISIISRIQQYQISFFILKKFPLFGVGVGNFISSIPLYESFKGRVFKLQPVHNIFLLYMSEFGLFGLSPIFIFYKKVKKYLRITPYSIYIILFGLLDHFLYTLNQGLLLLMLTIYLHIFIIDSNEN